MKTQTCLFSLLTILSLLRHSLSYTTSTNTTDFIRTSCTKTLYPELCYTSLSHYSNAVNQDPARLAKLSLAVTLNRARRTNTYISRLDPGSDPRAAAALRDCVTTFADAVDQISGSIVQMRRLAVGLEMSNVRTWMSAALTNEETCTDGFDGVGDEVRVKRDVCGRVGKVKKFTSVALALVNGFVDQSMQP